MRICFLKSLLQVETKYGVERNIGDARSGEKNHKKSAVILGVLVITLCFLAVILTQYITRFDWWKNLEWNYIGEEIVTPEMVQANNTKDPEFFRHPNHTLFVNEQGYYYLIFTAHEFPGILRTRNFTEYEFIGVINNLQGKVAPYVLLNPDDDRFYMFYSDWGNVIEGDINYARLGLAIGNFSEDVSSYTFEDQGYLNIKGSPLISPEAGWDPYIVKLNKTYYMIFSSAKHGVHLAKASQLGRDWIYTNVIVNETRENPALFSYQGTWYMLIGIYNGSGYDLYSSEGFLNWTLVERNWFIDPEYLVLPAGSTCALIDSTLYHLYQVLLNTDDYISGTFSLKLAWCKLST
jgi:hypothetical protein